MVRKQYVPNLLTCLGNSINKDDYTLTKIVQT